ncbi:MAG TPA: acyl-ACP--UDP-N-acetylglucosamine O-acyltransferase [Candidatus Manganitrophaceae bacterium]|nr:acyl-ACP--UDP-N-acetylglucosamine O-acyltransferase [Candidatus Manganitrophaceae bacterium]
MKIHPNAVIHPKAELSATVEVGPFSVIGEHVRIGSGTKIGAHVVIDGRTEIGEECVFFPFSSIGTAPQDLKYKGEPSRLKIGRKNTFREFVTLNRGTEQGHGETAIGDQNYFMAYVHVAHDCVIGDHVIMANAATLAGHITIGDHAILGGLTGVHQFVKIGAYVMIGGCSAVAQDVPPYVSVAGNRAKMYGLNLIGLKRHGFSTERIEGLKGAYKLLFRSGLTQREAIKQAREKWGNIADVESFISFVESSERGICR